MKTLPSAIACLLTLLGAAGAQAVEVESAAVGAAEVVLDYEESDSGVAVLTANALIAETNDARRGLRNDDRRRLASLVSPINALAVSTATPVSDSS